MEAIEARINFLYREFYREFGPVLVPESQELNWLWSELEKIESGPVVQ